MAKKEKGWIEIGWASGRIEDVYPKNPAHRAQLEKQYQELKNAGKIKGFTWLTKESR